MSSLCRQLSVSLRGLVAIWNRVMMTHSTFPVVICSSLNLLASWTVCSSSGVTRSSSARAQTASVAARRGKIASNRSFSSPFTCKHDQLMSRFLARLLTVAPGQLPTTAVLHAPETAVSACLNALFFRDQLKDDLITKNCNC